MDDDTFLGILLRARPATAADAALVTHLDAASVADAIGRLRDRGLVDGDGDTLTYPSPSVWATDAVSVHTRRIRTAVDDATSRIERVLRTLPAVVRASSARDTATEQVPTVLRHGERASEDLWWDLVQKPSGSLLATLPDVQRMLESPTERTVRFGEALSKKDTVRIIIPSSAVSDPRVQHSVALYEKLGLEYRTLAHVPAWFWVDGDYIALPHVWGEAVPTSVLGVHHPGLASIMRVYFDELWSRASPVHRREAPWTSILRLMQQGMTLEAASQQLGINARTGRRRVSAAMEYFGTTTLFSLATAWTAAETDDARIPPA